MNSFVNGATREASKKFTENGCEAYNTTGSKLLDMFATIGALRNRSEADICNIFDMAYAEDKLLATRILFYARDIRGGLGERRTFRTILRHAANNYPEIIKPNLDLIGVYGRYDDMYSLIGTKLEADMWNAMKAQWFEDIGDLAENQSVSLLAKWIKTPDSKSKETKRLGILTAKKLGYTDMRTFKHSLRQLRKQIDIVETYMCQNRWSEIKFSAVPSRAMMIYRKAFQQHAPEAFSTYINNVKAGTDEIKAGTLYPYDIVEKFFNRDYDNDAVLEAQWKALPDYVSDNINAIVMADVSGSMCGRPMASSVGLAIYFAQHNKGDFHNLYMTFSGDPKFMNIYDGWPLSSIIHDVENAPWGGSTNFLDAMNAILDVAVKNHVSAADMPKALICITDMEFDAATYSWNNQNGWSKSAFDRCREAFERNGYTLPKIVFWNVNARNDTFHTDKANIGTLCVSGQSTSSFKSIIDCIDKTPYEMMLAVVNSERYQPVVI